MTDEQLKAQAEALVHMQAAAVIFAHPTNAGGVAELEPDVVDDWWVSISRYARFCINHPPQKPWLADLWLWLSVRCWKAGKAARQDLPDPRKGLPKEQRGLLMDQVQEVSKGQWSPSQAALIRKALRGEMPLTFWHMTRSWRAQFSPATDERNEKRKGKVLIEEEGKIKTVERAKDKPPDAGPIIEGTAPKRKRKIRVKVRKKRSK